MSKVPANAAVRGAETAPTQEPLSGHAPLRMSTRQSEQRALVAGVATSPRQVAQRRELDAASGAGQGSARFRALSAEMGAQHGVDMSGLRATHGSAFPASVHADATTRGHRIDFAPGQDTDANIRHELGHHIVNAQRGTAAPADMRVNGHAVSTRDESAADHIAGAPLQRKAAPDGMTYRRAVAPRDGPVQRTEWEARMYIGQKGLWRRGFDLYALMAELFQECSPEYDEIHRRLINGLPVRPLPATDGYDPPTVHEVQGWLEQALLARRAQTPKEEPMPPQVRKRVQDWEADLDAQGLNRRASKSSDGTLKRAKMLREGGPNYKLYHTKTAPTDKKQPPEGQGQSAFFNQDQGQYFRSSLDNVQRDILGITSSNRMGDAQFANQLDARYSIKDGNTPQKMLTKAAVPTQGPFGSLPLRNFGHGNPSTKLGMEINSYTYQKLVAGSNKRTYQPPKSTKPTKEYLEPRDDRYFEQLGYLVDRHFDTPKDYETELFGHYQQIVTGARAIYGNAVCSIGKYKFRLVQAGMADKSNFLDYPAVIFEVDEPKHRAELAQIKKLILDSWNQSSSVKMTERQSFGFLYPSISDLEKSIRIWPGQFQTRGFLDVLRRILVPGLKPARAREQDEAQGQDDKPPPVMPLLQNTLKRSMNLATAAAYRVREPNPDVKLLFNRLASNYGKGLRLLATWSERGALPRGAEVLFAEATQIIENLNEAVLHLARQYDQRLAQSSFESAVLNHYLKYITPTGYEIDSFYLTHSGQQGSSSSMLLHGADRTFLKDSIADRGPIYFETMTSRKGSQQIKLVDPAYNFSCKEEVRQFATRPVKDAHIYDMTNVDPAELAGLLRTNPNPVVTLYASFSKHFQFGTDSTNLGFVMNLRRPDKDKEDKGKGEVKGKGERKRLGTYVPQGAVWDDTATGNPRKPAHVPSVPSDLYHHAALLFGVQTGSGSSQEDQQEAQAAPQQFFMGHEFSDWHGTQLFEVAEWVPADNDCGIHSLNRVARTPDSRQGLLDRFGNWLGWNARITLQHDTEWLDQDALTEIAQLAHVRLAVYEFNQEYGRWAFVAGDENNAEVFIGRVPHASGGGNTHWVPLRRRAAG